ncbi:hypothetical protein G4V39_02990 [Thermosulfuriphilus ammonigenes]|uniref:Uncharacterized protein n=1 Tax=Thermosulfuriphilus ammonigenes TaxID=1936021 RepID=A0A6G7PUE9_9BACT|nr:hypothetical protein [Thermosulfuriphilus ammonigenes]MBA2848548.1 hypothetical protein [Thermosulfuriphilus ammonigenes]QIJ71309.1 hypothetical protein G4V39_02990 [Thermosulfuriphilus ammonigenes]
MKPEDCTLYHSGLKGAEAFFGEMAEKWGVKEFVFTWEGRVPDRARNLIVLSEEELRRGDISMELVSRMMNRNYARPEKIRRVLQVIFHMVNKGYQVFIVGEILEDGNVKGGTGWAAQLAKLFNRPLHVFDQKQKSWFTWKEGSWVKEIPSISHSSFVGTGTRNLNDEGQKAIEELFRRSFSD